MSFQDVNARGLVLLGCGKMGSAMLEGWLKSGVDGGAVTILDPKPSDWVKSLKDVRLNGDLPLKPRICVIAVKPQMMGEALPALKAIAGPEVIFLSIAAGTSIAAFETAFGTDTPIIRAMPNTPAAIGKGITALIGNAAVNETDLKLAEDLLAAIGQTERLENEAQIDAVTAVSGSGPAYVFHLIETLAAAGEAEGLPGALAMRLAIATVEGAGALAAQSAEDASQLRVNVTSPGGTTAAALEVLMDGKSGLPSLMRSAVHAAAERGRELGRAS